MGRTPIMAGNWKMHKTVSEAVALASELARRCGAVRGVEVVIAPPYTALHAGAARVADSKVEVGAQTCHWESSGAYTGEVSPQMLVEAGCRWCILGHSERRQLFGETDETVNKRLRSVLAAGLRAIVCVGETLEEREASQTFHVVETQLKGALRGFEAAELERVVVAYEPVWAIGTGRTATPEQAEEVHAALRNCLTQWYDAATAGAMRILYGGSVKPGNIAELMAQDDIDGALVGGASLDADSFLGIIRYEGGA